VGADAKTSLAVGHMERVHPKLFNKTGSFLGLVIKKLACPLLKLFMLATKPKTTTRSTTFNALQ
jgi:hypothetical protein